MRHQGGKDPVVHKHPSPLGFFFGPPPQGGEETVSGAQGLSGLGTAQFNQTSRVTLAPQTTNRQKRLVGVGSGESE